MYCKNRFGIGASVVFAIHAAQVSEELFHRLLKEGLQDYRYRDEERFQPRTHRLLREGSESSAAYYPTDPPKARTGLTISFHWFNPTQGVLGIGFANGYRFLGAHLQADETNLEDSHWFNMFLRLVLSSFDFLRPAYGWGDDFDYLLSFKRKDERRFAFGLNLYGPEYAERIDRDRLLSAPAFRIDERPWGGIVVQLTENPFWGIPEEKREGLRDHLRLEEIAWESTTP